MGVNIQGTGRFTHEVATTQVDTQEKAIIIIAEWASRMLSGLETGVKFTYPDGTELPEDIHVAIVEHIGKLKRGEVSYSE